MKKGRKRFAALVLAALALSGCGGKTQPVQEETTVPAQAVSAEETTAVSCCGGDVTLRFRRGENGAWQWVDDPTFPLDGQYVEEIVAQAQALSSQLADPAAGEASVYGLDKTDRYLTVSQSDGTAQTWYFGARTESNDYYACASGSPERICVAPESLLNNISRSIYDMALLPKPLHLTSDMLRQVTIQRGAVRDELQVKQGVWLRNAREIHGEERIALLAAALENVAVDACFDYAPSAGAAALCGLDEGAAVLQVSYVNTVGVDSELTLCVGSYRPAQQGFCVTLNDDATIYLMDSALASLLAAW